MLGVLPYQNKWWSRLLTAEGILGQDATLWRSLEDHPGFSMAHAWLVDAGESEIDAHRGAQQMLTESLLVDVVDAACGIERAAALLQVHTRETQAWVDQYLRPQFDSAAPGSSVAAQDVRSTSHALTDLYWWVRCFTERVVREDRRNRRRYKVGLLPAIADGSLRQRVQSAFDEFQGEMLGARETANYAGHHSAIPEPGASAQVAPDFLVSMRVPDPPDRNVYSYRLLTFANGLSAVEFADHCMRTVAKFMDLVITAFESPDLKG